MTGGADYSLKCGSETEGCDTFLIATIVETIPGGPLTLTNLEKGASLSVLLSGGEYWNASGIYNGNPVDDTNFDGHGYYGNHLIWTELQKSLWTILDGALAVSSN